MILTVDAGNTRINCGLFKKNELVKTGSIETVSALLPLDIFADFLKSFVNGGNITGCVFASVVKEVNSVVDNAVKSVTGKEPLFLTGDLKCGINLSKYGGDSLGADRIADMAGAKLFANPPFAVFDLGTCTTMSAVDSDYNFTGGSISPGVQLMLKSMSEHASALPELKIDCPKSFPALDTAGCMQSGAVIGTAAMIDGFVLRLEDKLKSPVSVVITGGAAKYVAPYCKTKLIQKKDLLFYGLKEIYCMN